MRRIKKVAVLGSGTMGIGIAAQCANIGCDVLLLDMLNPKLTEENKNKKAARNSIADGALLRAVKAKKLHPFYDDTFATRVTTGNFEDDLPKIKDYDWVVEVVVEKLEIKQQLFEKVEKHRKQGTLITSNTSGIPMHMMTKGRSEDFKKHFCGTHFFNPVRFMRLLEIIPSADTDQEVIDFLMHYGDKTLGKQTVRCKDTPGFIGNRIGFFSGEEINNLTDKYDMSVEEVDALTGTAIGRPKTGSYRLRDLVGVDVGPKVSKSMITNLPDDPFAQQQKAKPKRKDVEFLLENKFLGNKTGQGYYKKEVQANGSTIYLALDLKTLEYKPVEQVELPVLEIAKSIRDLGERLQAMFASDDKGGQFLTEYFAKLFQYAAARIPEISDNVYSIDDAMRTGYAWDYGPFQVWDLIGIQKGVEMIEAQGLTVANWVTEMVAAGHSTFYATENGKKKYYDIGSKSFQVIPGTEEFIILDAYRDQSAVYKNDECILHDIGDGVLCLEFTSRNNAIGAGIITGMQEAVKIAEAGEWKGIVVGNNAKNFAVGANLKGMRENILAKNWEEMDKGGRAFQQANLILKYSKIPVVAAIQGFALGGGCEIPLHCDAVVAAAETFIGLVETGVGLIPGAGGTKEMALRASNNYLKGETHLPVLANYFSNVATAAVSRSGHNAFTLGHLLTTNDQVVPNVMRNIGEAKQKVLELADNYIPPSKDEAITVLGRTGLGTLYAVINSYKLGHFMSDYDVHIARKIACVMCGGDLTGTQQVSEDYLLDVEREAFMSLAGEQKTLDRIEHMLKTGKPLRN